MTLQVSLREGGQGGPPRHGEGDQALLQVSTVQYSIQYSTVQYTVQYSTVQYTVQYSTGHPLLKSSRQSKVIGTVTSLGLEWSLVYIAHVLHNDHKLALQFRRSIDSSHAAQTLLVETGSGGLS